MRFCVFGLFFSLIFACSDDFDSESQPSRLPGFRDASLAPVAPQNTGESIEMPEEQDDDRPIPADTQTPETQDDVEFGIGDGQPPQSASAAPSQQEPAPSDNRVGDPSETNTAIGADGQPAVNEDDSNGTDDGDEDGAEEALDPDASPDGTSGNLLEELQTNITASCVSAGCHSSQSNLRSLENLSDLLGESPSGSGTPYIVPGDKDASYLYNVLLPFQERSVAISGSQMPPPYRPAQLARSPLQLRTLKAQVGQWIDSLAP